MHLIIASSVRTRSIRSRPDARARRSARWRPPPRRGARPGRPCTLVGALVVLGYGARDERRAGVRARALDSRPSSHRAFPGGRPAPRRPEASPSSASPHQPLSLTNRGSPPRAPFSQRTPPTSPPPGAEARGTISRRGPSPRTSRARVVPAETTSSSRASGSDDDRAVVVALATPTRPDVTDPSAARSTPPAPTMTPTSSSRVQRRAPRRRRPPRRARRRAELVRGPEAPREGEGVSRPPRGWRRPLGRGRGRGRGGRRGGGGGGRRGVAGMTRRRRLRMRRRRTHATRRRTRSFGARTRPGSRRAPRTPSPTSGRAAPPAASTAPRGAPRGRSTPTVASVG